MPIEGVVSGTVSMLAGLSRVHWRLGSSCSVRQLCARVVASPLKWTVTRLGWPTLSYGLLHCTRLGHAWETLKLARPASNLEPMSSPDRHVRMCIMCASLEGPRREMGLCDERSHPWETSRLARLPPNATRGGKPDHFWCARPSELRTPECGQTWLGRCRILATSALPRSL